MGRSRKPLYGQLYRGFESLSLRKPNQARDFVAGFFMFTASGTCSGEHGNMKKTAVGDGRAW
jgi:hypothetical protein